MDSWQLELRDNSQQGTQSGGWWARPRRAAVAAVVVAGGAGRGGALIFRIGHPSTPLCDAVRRTCSVRQAISPARNESQPIAGARKLLGRKKMVRDEPPRPNDQNMERRHRRRRHNDAAPHAMLHVPLAWWMPKRMLQVHTIQFTPLLLGSQRHVIVIPCCLLVVVRQHHHLQHRLPLHVPLRHMKQYRNCCQSHAPCVTAEISNGCIGGLPACWTNPPNCPPHLRGERAHQRLRLGRHGGAARQRQHVRHLEHAAAADAHLEGGRSR